MIQHIAPPEQYTRATPVPPAPVPLCAIAGAPVLCNGQLTDLLTATANALGECNADKAGATAWAAQVKQ